MKPASLFVTIILIVFFLPLSGQKIRVVEGNLKDLKGIKELNIIYDYSDLTVGKLSEEEYIAKKVTEKNEDEAGTGDLWKESWLNDRPGRYEPKFEELFAKYAPGINFGKDVAADVTMGIHTSFIEPGYNVGISRRPAFINLEIDFIKEGQVVVSMVIQKSPGQDAMGSDFDTGWRISEAYAKAGKALGRYLTDALE